MEFNTETSRWPQTLEWWCKCSTQYFELFCWNVSQRMFSNLFWMNLFFFARRLYTCGILTFSFKKKKKILWQENQSIYATRAARPSTELRPWANTWRSTSPSPPSGRSPALSESQLLHQTFSQSQQKKNNCFFLLLFFPTWPAAVTRSSSKPKISSSTWTNTWAWSPSSARRAGSATAGRRTGTRTSSRTAWPSPTSESQASVAAAVCSNRFTI